ncbi:hypothetical protein U8527_13645 [Kordia algicida OT-1]|uniref:Uncharacterized protein n=1 Tax=Kordia algicida OT-1 TaxID=391587 RepID=A9DWZ5_9FLAO|nr:hypothetical protein [Kordia algicida]EDP95942.1 hypothetical protein KAOT1_07233 [Kordia algicida OT-1]
MIALEELRSFTGYLALATLIFGIISYKNYSSTNAKYFIYSILISVITEFTSLYFKSFGTFYSNIFGQTNFPIANIFIIVQITFYLCWIRYILNSKNRKRIIGLFIIAYLLFSALNLIYGQVFMTGLQTYTYAIGVIFLLITISFYFVESFNKETIFNIMDSIKFWFILGVLLFYGTFMPFMFAFNVFLEGDQRIFSLVTFALNAIMYGCFVVGFYKSYKVRNQQL